MTRKDYIALARSFADAKPTKNEPREYTIQWHADIDSVAETLADDNPRFDRARFLAACGVS